MLRRDDFLEMVWLWEVSAMQSCEWFVLYCAVVAIVAVTIAILVELQ